MVSVSAKISSLTYLPNQTYQGSTYSTHISDIDNRTIVLVSSRAESTQQPLLVHPTKTPFLLISMTLSMTLPLIPHRHFDDLRLRLDELMSFSFPSSLQFFKTMSTSHHLRLFDNYARSAMNILNIGTLRTNDKPDTKNTI